MAGRPGAERLRQKNRGKREMTTTVSNQSAAASAPGHPPMASIAGSAYGTVIADQLVRERERKTSLEQLGSFAELPIRDLKERVTDNAWFVPDPAEAARDVAAVQVKRLEQARGYNTTKKHLFAAGVLVEILGITAIAFALAHHMTTG